MRLSRRARGVLVWFGLVVLAPAAPAKDPPPPARVAVADFVVTGLTEPRYWLGYLYAEVLARRLLLTEGLVVIEPLEVRQVRAVVGPQNLDGLRQRAAELARELAVPHVITGQIDDRGERVAVSAMIVSADGKHDVAGPIEVPFARLYEPQNEIVVRRFLRNLRAPVTRSEQQAMVDYDPGLSQTVAELIGKGWRAYAPAEPETAFRYWRQALTEDPNCRLAREALAGASYLYRRVLIEQSLAFYENLALVEPRNPQAHYHLGQIYADLGRWEQAEREYETAVALRKSYLEAYLGLGLARLERGLLAQAIAAYQGALTISPDHRQAMHNLAVAFFRRGMRDEAMATWRRLLELDPDDQLAMERLRLYGQGGAVGP